MNKLVQYIRKNMETKTTKDLLRIWIENNTEQWSQETFEVVHQLLEERGERIPLEKDAVGPKIEDLKNEDIRVRNAAAKALGNIGDLRAVDSLIGALSDKAAFVRCAAAEALGKIGDQRAVDSLIEATKDEDNLVRKSAVTALGQIGDGRAFDALAGCLADEMMPVIEAAKDALKKRGWLDLAYAAAKNAVANNNYRKLIMKGESEGVLILAIKRYANKHFKPMAIEYLNCGNGRLRRAAESWAASTGHTIVALKSSFPGIIWGSHREKSV
jgi:hypothetical protein